MPLSKNVVLGKQLIPKNAVLGTEIRYFYV